MVERAEKDSLNQINDCKKQELKIIHSFSLPEKRRELTAMKASKCQPSSLQNLSESARARKARNFE